MTLETELGLPHTIIDPHHAVIMSVVVTATMLAKEGDRLMRPLGLTEPQMNILMLLKYQSTSNGLDQSSLGRMLVVNRANITGLIDRMERDALVARKADPQDRRVKRVRMTTKGLAALETAEKPYIARVREVMGSLSAAEREALSRSLEKLRASLKKRPA